MSIYSVIRVENRASGKWDHAGYVQADSLTEARDIAASLIECDELHSLRVDQCDDCESTEAAPHVLNQVVAK